MLKPYFLSALSITSMQVIEMSAQSFNLMTVLLQLIIFFLTARKLYIDIKDNKYKDIESEEKKIKRKYPFLTALKELINKNRIL